MSNTTVRFGVEAKFRADVRPGYSLQLGIEDEHRVKQLLIVDKMKFHPIQ